MHPLVVELKHSWNSPDIVRTIVREDDSSIPSSQVQYFQAYFVPNAGNFGRIAEFTPRS